MYKINCSSVGGYNMEKKKALEMIENMEINPELKEKLIEIADELDEIFERIDKIEACH